MNYVVEGSSPVAVTDTSDFAPASSKEFLDIQATMECGFTLKCVTYRYQCSVSTFKFEQVFVSSVKKTSHNVLKKTKAIYFYRNKSCKAYFIQGFIIAPNWNKLWTFGNISALLLL